MEPETHAEIQALLKGRHAKHAAREAVIEAARELTRATYANSYGRWFTNGTKATALREALAALDALTPPDDAHRDWEAGMPHG